jgi:hypothetical protein
MLAPVIDIPNCSLNGDGTLHGCIVLSSGATFCIQAKYTVNAQNRLHSKMSRDGSGIRPSIRGMSKFFVHNEYHKDGYYHNWYGPAIVHGNQKDYWLYGFRVSESSWRAFTNNVDKQRADSDFGRRLRDGNYSPAQFFSHCTIKNDKLNPVLGKNHNKRRSRKATTEQLTKTIKEQRDLIARLVQMITHPN